MRFCRVALALLIWIYAGLCAAQMATITPAPTVAAVMPTPTATPDLFADIEKREHFLLRRPIAVEAGRTHWADRTYPYGSTQWGNRAVHLGVEFVNPRHTPVLAAAAGSVVFAGDDSETQLGPRLDYYGNVVVLSHDLRSLDGQPVFTLYAHLETIDVSAGQELEAGQPLGTVGSSGVALGAHLHFEVRVGDPFDHRATRNPALWLRNYPSRGLIAGQVRSAVGESIIEKRIVARSETLRREVYTYGGSEVNSDPVWRENFSISDLAAGDYEIVILKDNGAIGFRETVAVVADEITFVDITIAD